MPASLPGDSALNNAGNPTLGDFVIMDPLSGPKGAPLDAMKIDYSTGTPPGWNATTRIPIKIADPGNLSTGALSTGIGIGPTAIGPASVMTPYQAGFDDNLTPGKDVLTYAAPPPNGVVATDEFDSTMLYIGGGRDIANTGTTVADAGRPYIPSPYTAGIALVGAGNGGSRDSGANTGFALKMVTNPGTTDIANGVAVEAGFVNRTGGVLAGGQSTFGSATAALGAPS